MLVIDDILLSPIRGFQWVMRTVLKVAEEQYTDDAPLKERLLELQVKLENGDVTEDEYLEEEAAILAELREVQNRKREMAGVPREDAPGGLYGKVQEGSGAELTFTPTDTPQLEIEAPQFTYGGEVVQPVPPEVEARDRELAPAAESVAQPIEKVRVRRHGKKRSPARKKK